MDWKNCACFSHVNWNPGPKDFRSFALSMLIGFAAIGLIVAWRHGGLGNATFVLWGVGVVLAAASQIPGLNRAAYLLVYLVSGVLGYVISHVFLTILFFLVFVPIGCLLRAAGKDILHLRARPHAVWLKRGPPASRNSYYRTF